LKIVEEVQKNPGEKRVDISKCLGLAPNSTFAKDKIREQIEKCGNANKRKKTGRESTFTKLKSVLFTSNQQAQAFNIPVDGTILREKAKTTAVQLNIENVTASNGWMAWPSKHEVSRRKGSSGQRKHRSVAGKTVILVGGLRT
jgi:hypothetical protein